MYIDNPLLQFDFNSLKQGYGQLQGMPSLVGREQTLQPAPQLQDSGFSRQVQPGPVYGLAPQRPNAPLYGEYDAGPGAYMGQESMPGNVSLGDVGSAMSSMMSGGVLGLIGGIAGIVGQSMANTKASAFEPSLLTDLLGIKGPEGVNFGAIDNLGLGFGNDGGGGGYGSDSPGGMAGDAGTDPGGTGMGAPGGDTSGMAGMV